MGPDAQGLARGARPSLPGRPALVLAGLAALALLAVLAFLTVGARGSWSFVLAFRGRRLLALLLVAYCVAVSTVLFQTLTRNRILTPSIMGFDALYVLMQTTVAVVLGVSTLTLADPRLRFLGEATLMAGFSALLFRWLFLGEERSLHRLVLAGIVFGILFRSLSAFLQRLLDPNSFQILQDSLFASFGTADTLLLGVSAALVAAVTVGLWRLGPAFDVLALGRDHAINLGLDHARTVLLIWLAVSVLVAVSTALVGPVAFFGLLVASLAHALVGRSRHREILPAACLVAVVVLVGGQTVLERVFAFDTALSVIVDFLGGLVFLALVLRGAAR
ncbi:enterobactin ABC transporter permease [Aureimonas flava]|uniref:Enterobactin ABC transporter permease n=1 Tax=Aureimonas flava TaxID=2320271 RepID=A0A3A1WFA0_9HYPH|nr:iron chelate uptake ABC transporter family permease subunit [Aureimonas flava]RIX98469.1 enterobactin ABC transporter permease [Aureimonas flava]